MRDQMAKLAATWEPGEEAEVFRTDGEQEEAQGSSDYFLESSERVHFFGEVDAVDEAGKLLPGLSKLEALNKAGHALHSQDPVFERYSTSRRVGKLVRALGWKEPVLPQSMYIFKQPRIGGEGFLFLALFMPMPR